MEWTDDALVLGIAKHGETSAIIEVFTLQQGRHVGVVRGGTSRKIARADIELSASKGRKKS